MHHRQELCLSRINETLLQRCRSETVRGLEKSDRYHEFIIGRNLIWVQAAVYPGELSVEAYREIISKTPSFLLFRQIPESVV